MNLNLFVKLQIKIVNLRFTEGFLVETFVSPHVQRHLALFAFETLFMPYLKPEEQTKLI